MNDFERRPGAIDDPGTGEPEAADLDMPGPEDPVAWSFVEAETLVVGPGGEELGRVAAMLGTENEGIFHGVAVTPYRDGSTRMVPADAVTRLTTSRVEIALDADALAEAEEFRLTRV
jgi:hypothetical protein